jgi:hypothetical protein
VDRKDWERVEKYGQDVEVSSGGQKIDEGKAIASDSGVMIVKPDGTYHHYNAKDFDIDVKEGD